MSSQLLVVLWIRRGQTSADSLLDFFLRVQKL
jgi:hypothetical protein